MLIIVGLILNITLLDSDPYEIIKLQSQKFVQILRETNDKDKAKSIIKNSLEEFVDFDYFAYLTLQKYWESINESQKKEFKINYKALIESIYTKKFNPKKEISIEVSEEVIWNDKKDKALISSKIKYEKSEVDLKYKFHKNEKDKWLVYDIVIDDVSMVNNYRKSFYKIMKEEGFNSLIKKIREKISKKD